MSEEIVCKRSSEGWHLKRTKQCKACPWKKSTNPFDIPDGYSVDKHCALKSTIAKPGSLDGVFAPGIHVMACHETQDAHCIGWLMNQLGPGNNIPLRLRVRTCENFDAVQTFGDQHERFEDTIPEE